MHAITVQLSGKPEMYYNIIPAAPTFEDGKLPIGRTNHAACAFHENVAVFGGCNDKDELIDEQCAVWLFNPERKTWDSLVPSSTDSMPGPRHSARLFAQETCLVLFGGIDPSGSAASDLWQFDVASRTWSQLPTAPVATSNAALSNGQLWLISGSDPMSSQLNHLDISSPRDEMSWESFTFPTNPMAPGPRARHDGALLPVHTGYGRNYLIYLLGAREDPPDFTHTYTSEDLEHSKGTTQWSDTWVLQLPSSNLEAKASLSLKEAIKPAKIKDTIRSAFGAETGRLSWAEAVLQVPSEKELEDEDGKLHPGPRAFFGADVMENGHSLVLWGGLDARGERVGDGWIIRLE